jgi:hypothetical protein
MINVTVDGGLPEQRDFILRTIAQSLAYIGMRPVFPGGAIKALDPATTVRGGSLQRSLLNESVMLAPYSSDVDRNPRITGEVSVEVRKYAYQATKGSPWSFVKDLERYLLTGEVPSDTTIMEEGKEVS